MLIQLYLLSIFFIMGEGIHTGTQGAVFHWPSGTYCLPKPESGCPDGWEEGWRKQDMEDDGPHQSIFSSNFHMDAVLNNDCINRSFCIKTLANDERNTSWPAGSYCIYKKFQCPSGMKVGWIKWDDEDKNFHPNKNDKSGILPDGVYDTNTKIYYCCQNGGEWSNSIELPVDQPFYLLPRQSEDCQRVKWALSSLEYIVYDTEDNGNKDEFSGTHVLSNKEQSLPKIYYCYYKDCRYIIRGDYGEFFSNISNGSYPEFQFCRWLVSVSQDSVVSLNLTYLLPSNCTESYIDIFDGENDTFPLLSRYCGQNTTLSSHMISNGSSILVLFKSGKRFWPPTIIEGFYILYKAMTPTTTSSPTPTATQTTSTMRIMASVGPTGTPRITTKETSTAGSTEANVATSKSNDPTNSGRDAVPGLDGITVGLSTILLTLAGIIIIIGVLVIAIIFYRRRSNNVTPPSGDNEGNTEGNDNTEPQYETIDDIRDPSKAQYDPISHYILTSVQSKTVMPDQKGRIYDIPKIP